ncbi:MAG: hypothetical protein M3380_14160, partial [Chloroflexota bacterium]|nr:hypothetical protein [Chloroflexota bacterium]
LNTLGAAAALVATTLSSHYYGLFCAVYTVAHVGLAILFLPAWRARLSVFATAVAVALLWCGLLLPFVWPPEELGAAVLRDWYERQTFHSAELVDFVAPNVLHPLWGDLSLAWLSSLHRFGPESGAGAGIAVYALAGWGVVRYRRCAWPWLALALLMAVLALGPELTFGGKPSGIPLPFRLLDVVGPFRNSSRPSRIIAVMMLPLSISAGFGMEALRTGIRRRGRLLAVCAGLLIFVEYMVKPWNILQFNVDPLYMSLNNDPAPGAVIELPPLNDDGRYMVNQMCHGRPLVGGYLARAPIHSVVASPSVLRHLWDATPIPADIWSYDAAGELATLGIRFITLHLADLSPAEVAQLHRLLATPGLTLRSEGNQIETYDVDPQAARPLLLPTQGWYAPETNGQRTWRWIGDEARARLFVPTDGAISLSFTGTAYQSPRKLRVRIDDRLQSEYDVPANAERSMSISFIIPAGEHSLSLESEAVASPDGRRISVSLSHVGISSAGVAPASPRALEPPPVIAQTAGPPCQ